MRALLLILILLTSTQVFSKEIKPCYPTSILGEVTTYKKVSGKIEERKSWHALPEVVSLHTGEFGRLKFKMGSHLRLTYIGKTYKKILKRRLNKELIADINFVKWFDDAHTFKGGQLKIELLSPNKKNSDDDLRVICTHNMEITGGD